ncbi:MULTISPECIES: FAD-binding oxidoreductase [Rhizobium]|uniref:D-lactate dehydrogenase (cytochrome) n=1 Tax=Rhizobium rhododendri TaxID=2506430 RepID=A0ABY8INF5_9HYPH|nr:MULTISPECIES: FAD-linked oxidase C-terminal domain-containing protein [Rhizobium]MBO9101036.1 FAD-binding protein [Rhizobium sp. L58/93]MBO9136837.1 FAD-binding protein [Rhizobium sp. B209b/85]MBO9171630.1 FAD-binding protein [Rhizobium sp. L245/93]MBO9186625.1 FAD-binding protein [Rhizobium sp. E27B/91]QXZ85998.1 FAD-binding protein [Rhizobium sp. K1/93]
MTHLSTELSDKLRAIFGDRFSTSPALREQHGRGESYHTAAMPDGVVFAEHTDEVAQTVRLCAAEGVPVIAFGAGTSLEGHLTAICGGISIDLSRMSLIVRVGAEDLDCTVEAGVTREQLNTHLRDKGLFFPIDPGANASIGGMAATRASGTNAVRYGTMRENVLSLTVVLPSGQVVRTGGRARKSSAGYDLTRLFIGSEGTLGIITEVTLRLYGIPETITAALCSFASVEQAVDTAIAVVQLGIPVARMELMDRGLIAAVNAYSNLTLKIEDTLAFEFHGSPAAVQEQVDMVAAIVDEHGGRDFEWANAAEDRNRLWKARHNAFYAVVSQRQNAKGWSSDVCVPVSELSDCILKTRALLQGCSVPAAILGHVGDGNYHVVFAVDPDNRAELDEVAAINKAMVLHALSVGGTSTGEHGIGTGKIDYLRREHGDAVDLMAVIKAAIDPMNIMNPGKILPE